MMVHIMSKMKETDAIHGLAMRLEDVPLRHMQVR